MLEVRLILAAILLFHFSALLGSAQAASSTSRNTGTPEILVDQNTVNKVLSESEVLFKEGLRAYTDNHRSVAGEKFNKSVEVFLYSKLNIQRDAKLQGCYNPLIETVYRIEFPSETQLPQIKNLAQTCSWNLDTVLADKVSQMVRSKVVKPFATTLKNQSNIGFNGQEFEPSPLDELSKLELTPDEQQIDSNPIAKQQYQYIPYAAANKSLGFSFEVHRMIQHYINYYQGRGRTTMEVGLYRSGMFMRMARRIFMEEGVPENVAWLGQVKSGWKSNQIQGLWDLSPSISTRFGLSLNKYVSEVNSFDEATRAAARYLKFLANHYGGNWELAMAAYNAGENTVDKAIRSAGVASFWSAYQYLPKETRDIVPNILATTLIANSPNQYGFGDIRPAPSLAYDRIRIPASTNLSIVAQVADTNVQYLRYLNPHLRGNITPPMPYIINVPAGKANEVLAIFRRIPASKIDNTNLANSSSRETWQTISNRTGVSVAVLMDANQGMATPIGKVFIPLISGNNGPTIRYGLSDSIIGTKPAQTKDGKVQAVMNYFNQTLNDPYSMRFVRWSEVAEGIKDGSSYWVVTVKFRAKNGFGAYILREQTFYIRNNRVVKFGSISEQSTSVNDENVNSIVYRRAARYGDGRVSKGIRIVKAKSDDTVQKVAERYNANATDVAKYNGLLPNSVLGAGREIKIPSN